MNPSSAVGGRPFLSRNVRISRQPVLLGRKEVFGVKPKYGRRRIFCKHFKEEDRIQTSLTLDADTVAFLAKRMKDDLKAKQLQQAELEAVSQDVFGNGRQVLAAASLGPPTELAELYAAVGKAGRFDQKNERLVRLMEVYRHSAHSVAIPKIQASHTYHPLHACIHRVWPAGVMFLLSVGCDPLQRGTELCFAGDGLPTGHDKPYLTEKSALDMCAGLANALKGELDERERRHGKYLETLHTFMSGPKAVVQSRARQVMEWLRGKYSAATRDFRYEVQDKHDPVQQVISIIASGELKGRIALTPLPDSSADGCAYWGTGGLLTGGAQPAEEDNEVVVVPDSSGTAAMDVDVPDLKPAAGTPTVAPTPAHAQLLLAVGMGTRAGAGAAAAAIDLMEEDDLSMTLAERLEQRRLLEATAVTPVQATLVVPPASVRQADVPTTGSGIGSAAPEHAPTTLLGRVVAAAAPTFGDWVRPPSFSAGLAPILSALHAKQGVVCEKDDVKEIVARVMEYCGADKESIRAVEEADGHLTVQTDSQLWSVVDTVLNCSPTATLAIQGLISSGTADSSDHPLHHAVHRMRAGATRFFLALGLSPDVKGTVGCYSGDDCRAEDLKGRTARQLATLMQSKVTSGGGRAKKAACAEISSFVKSPPTRPVDTAPAAVEHEGDGTGSGVGAGAGMGGGMSPKSVDYEPDSMQQDYAEAEGMEDVHEVMSESQEQEPLYSPLPGTLTQLQQELDQLAGTTSGGTSATMDAVKRPRCRKPVTVRRFLAVRGEHGYGWVDDPRHLQAEHSRIYELCRKELIKAHKELPPPSVAQFQRAARKNYAELDGDEFVDEGGVDGAGTEGEMEGQEEGWVTGGWEARKAAREKKEAERRAKDWKKQWKKEVAAYLHTRFQGMPSMEDEGGEGEGVDGGRRHKGPARSSAQQGAVLKIRRKDRMEDGADSDEAYAVEEADDEGGSEEEHVGMGMQQDTAGKVRGREPIDLTKDSAGKPSKRRRVVLPKDSNPEYRMEVNEQTRKEDSEEDISYYLLSDTDENEELAEMMEKGGISVQQIIGKKPSRPRSKARQKPLSAGEPFSLKRYAELLGRARERQLRTVPASPRIPRHKEAHAARRRKREASAFGASGAGAGLGAGAGRSGPRPADDLGRFDDSSSGDEARPYVPPSRRILSALSDQAAGGQETGIEEGGKAGPAHVQATPVAMQRTQTHASRSTGSGAGSRGRASMAAKPYMTALDENAAICKAINQRLQPVQVNLRPAMDRVRHGVRKAESDSLLSVGVPSLAGAEQRPAALLVPAGGFSAGDTVALLGLGQQVMMDAPEAVQALAVANQDRHAQLHAGALRNRGLYAVPQQDSAAIAHLLQLKAETRQLERQLTAGKTLALLAKLLDGQSRSAQSRSSMEDFGPSMSRQAVNRVLGAIDIDHPDGRKSRLFGSTRGLAQLNAAYEQLGRNAEDIPLDPSTARYRTDQIDEPSLQQKRVQWLREGQVQPLPQQSVKPSIYKPADAPHSVPLPLQQGSQDGEASQILKADGQKQAGWVERVKAAGHSRVGGIEAEDGLQTGSPTTGVRPQDSVGESQLTSQSYFDTARDVLAALKPLDTQAHRVLTPTSAALSPGVGSAGRCTDGSVGETIGESDAAAQVVDYSTSTIISLPRGGHFFPRPFPQPYFAGTQCRLITLMQAACLAPSCLRADVHLLPPWSAMLHTRQTSNGVEQSNCSGPQDSIIESMAVDPPSEFEDYMDSRAPAEALSEFIDSCLNHLVSAADLNKLRAARILLTRVCSYLLVEVRRCDVEASLAQSSAAEAQREGVPPDESLNAQLGYEDKGAQQAREKGMEHAAALEQARREGEGHMRTLCKILQAITGWIVTMSSRNSAGALGKATSATVRHVLLYYLQLMGRVVYTGAKAGHATDDPVAADEGVDDLTDFSPAVLCGMTGDDCPVLDAAYHTLKPFACGPYTIYPRAWMLPVTPEATVQGQGQEALPCMTAQSLSMAVTGACSVIAACPHMYKTAVSAERTAVLRTVMLQLCQVQRDYPASTLLSIKSLLVSSQGSLQGGTLQVCSPILWSWLSILPHCGSSPWEELCIALHSYGPYPPGLAHAFLPDDKRLPRTIAVETVVVQNAGQGTGQAAQPDRQQQGENMYTTNSSLQTTQKSGSSKGSVVIPLAEAAALGNAPVAFKSFFGKKAPGAATDTTKSTVEDNIDLKSAHYSKFDARMLAEHPSECISSLGWELCLSVGLLACAFSRHEGKGADPWSHACSSWAAVLVHSQDVPSQGAQPTKEASTAVTKPASTAVLLGKLVEHITNNCASMSLNRYSKVHLMNLLSMRAFDMAWLKSSPAQSRRYARALTYASTDMVQSMLDGLARGFDMRVPMPKDTGEGFVWEEQLPPQMVSLTGAGVLATMFNMELLRCTSRWVGYWWSVTNSCPGNAEDARVATSIMRDAALRIVKRAIVLSLPPPPSAKDPVTPSVLMPSINPWPLNISNTSTLPTYGLGDGLVPLDGRSTWQVMDMLPGASSSYSVLEGLHAVSTMNAPLPLLRFAREHETDAREHLDACLQYWAQWSHSPIEGPLPTQGLSLSQRASVLQYRRCCLHHLAWMASNAVKAGWCAYAATAAVERGDRVESLQHQAQKDIWPIRQMPVDEAAAVPASRRVILTHGPGMHGPTTPPRAAGIATLAWLQSLQCAALIRTRDTAAVVAENHSLHILQASPWGSDALGRAMHLQVLATSLAEVKGDEGLKAQLSKEILAIAAATVSSLVPLLYALQLILEVDVPHVWLSTKATALPYPNRGKALVDVLNLHFQGASGIDSPVTAWPTLGNLPRVPSLPPSPSWCTPAVQQWMHTATHGSSERRLEDMWTTLAAELSIVQQLGDFSSAVTRDSSLFSVYVDLWVRKAKGDDSALTVPVPGSPVLHAPMHALLRISSEMQHRLSIAASYDCLDGAARPLYSYARCTHSSLLHALMASLQKSHTHKETGAHLWALWRQAATTPERLEALSVLCTAFENRSLLFFSSVSTGLHWLETRGQAAGAGAGATQPEPVPSSIEPIDPSNPKDRLEPRRDVRYLLHLLERQIVDSIASLARVDSGTTADFSSLVAHLLPAVIGHPFLASPLSSSLAPNWSQPEEGRQSETACLAGTLAFLAGLWALWLRGCDAVRGEPPHQSNLNMLQAFLLRYGLCAEKLSTSHEGPSSSPDIDRPDSSPPTLWQKQYYAVRRGEGRSDVEAQAVAKRALLLSAHVIWPVLACATLGSCALWPAVDFRDRCPTAVTMVGGEEAGNAAALQALHPSLRGDAASRSSLTDRAARLATERARCVAECRDTVPGWPLRSLLYAYSRIASWEQLCPRALQWAFLGIDWLLSPTLADSRSWPVNLVRLDNRAFLHMADACVGVWLCLRAEVARSPALQPSSSLLLRAAATYLCSSHGPVPAGEAPFVSVPRGVSVHVLETCTHELDGLQGAALAAVLQRALNHPNFLAFAELFHLPSCQALRSTDQRNVVRLLEVASYGTYADFKNERASFPSVQEQFVHKMRILTLSSQAAQLRKLSYDQVRADLDLASDADVEALITQAIYSGMVSGKLDQRSRTFDISSAAGRDARQGPELEGLLQRLHAWRASIAFAQDATHQQIDAVAKEITASKIAKDEYNRRLESEAKSWSSGTPTAVPPSVAPRSQGAGDSAPRTAAQAAGRPQTYDAAGFPSDSEEDLASILAMEQGGGVGGGSAASAMGWAAGHAGRGGQGNKGMHRSVKRRTDRGGLSMVDNASDGGEHGIAQAKPGPA